MMHPSIPSYADAQLRLNLSALVGIDRDPDFQSRFAWLVGWVPVTRQQRERAHTGRSGFDYAEIDGMDHGATAATARATTPHRSCSTLVRHCGAPSHLERASTTS